MTDLHDQTPLLRRPETYTRLWLLLAFSLGLLLGELSGYYLALQMLYKAIELLPK